ncbi:tetratricopeptide repeat protein [Pseudoduganella violacea]|nr:tetratricopeptide repeat protein [Pseudoduganella violacea]
MPCWPPRRHLAALALSLPAALALAEAPPAGSDEAPPESQQLYQEALQSIAEGRKNDASATLQRVIENEPLHAGAWLDLALIQCALGHTAEAERLFAAVEVRFDPPEDILKLIAEAREKGCAGWQPHSQSSFSVGRGIDQNVNQGAREAELLLPDFLPKHDQYSTLSADHVRDLTPNGSIGFVQYQARRYDQLHQYDSASLYAGVESPWRFGRWTLRANAMLGLITLGGQLYQRLSQVQLRVGPPLPLPGSWQFSVTGGLTHVAYTTLENFDANTVELRSQLSYRGGDSYASLSLAAQRDHALAARPGGDRHGWQVAAQWRRRLYGELIGELGYNRQQWNNERVYAPGFLDQVRRQASHLWRATLSYPLTRTQSLIVEGRAVRNKENISIFQYNDRQLQISWQWQTP